jgi:hypothetical protein
MLEQGSGVLILTINVPFDSSLRMKGTVSGRTYAPPREKTFSVGDQIRHSVTIFRENGDELNTYNGGLFMFKLPVPLFQMDTLINFQPIEMCCSRRGNYVISSTDGTLHVLDPYGKLLGIAFIISLKFLIQRIY